MNNFFKKDITFRILAILFAITLSYLVNPVKTVNIEVPLTVINEGSLQDKNLKLNDNSFIRNVVIKARGREEQLKNLNSADFQAVLDLKKISSVDDRVVAINGPAGVKNGILVVDMSPKVVQIQLESVISDTFKVEVETKGSPKSGYKVISKAASPEQIVLLGVNSDIKNVSRIKVTVDINGKDRDTLYEKQIINVLDKKGNEIPEFGKDRFVDVNVKVAKEVPVKIITRGSFADDVIGTVKAVTPGTVLITGDYAVVSQIKEIKTEPLNISNIKSTTELTVLLDIPEGVKLHEIPKEVKVTVEAEQLIVREVILSREEISINGSDSAMLSSIVTPEIRVIVKGRSAVLDSLASSDLKASVNIEGLGAGSHRVPVTITIPANLELIGAYNVEVSIQKPEEA